jgi:putative ABC transport system permease protein
MAFRDLIRDVFRTLWAHRVRTLLTMFGIAWGVVSIVLMVAAGEGLRVGQQKQAETLGRDLRVASNPAPLLIARGS